MHHKSVRVLCISIRSQIITSPAADSTLRIEQIENSPYGKGTGRSKLSLTILTGLVSHCDN